jgi:hypothetical protein
MACFSRMKVITSLEHFDLTFLNKWSYKWLSHGVVYILESQLDQLKEIKNNSFLSLGHLKNMSNPTFFYSNIYLFIHLFIGDSRAWAQDLTLAR